MLPLPDTCCWNTLTQQDHYIPAACFMSVHHATHMQDGKRGKHQMLTMTNDRSIIVTDSDFVLLRTLQAHEHLAAELENAEIVAASRVPPHVVTMNSRVLFEDVSTGERREITIVFPQDADILRAKVSVLAPVGTALLGLSEGDSIVWPFP